MKAFITTKDKRVWINPDRVSAVLEKETPQAKGSVTPGRPGTYEILMDCGVTYEVHEIGKLLP